MELLYLSAGFITGVIVSWLILKARSGSASILKEKLEHTEQTIEELQLSREKSEQEIKELNTKLIDESSKRAAAEKECEQILKLEKSLKEKDQQITELMHQANALTATIAELETTVDKERQQTKEKLSLLDESKEQMSLQFKDIAAKLLEEKSKKFSEQNAEKLGVILKPLGTKIDEFQKRVADSNDKNSKERIELKKHIELLTNLNSKLSEDAHNLTVALKGDSKTQGNWGELVLERILEASGLTKGLEYDTQISHTTNSGKRYQPDVIINLPENKHIVVDSKVSLKAYETYCAAEDDQQREAALKAHINSLKKHVKELSEKNYHDLPQIKSLDFVLLFIPIEPAYGLALQTETDLFFDAFSKNIVIVTPSSLLATLRTVAYIWRQEAQNRNAATIAQKAGQLYDKFVNFIEDMDKIGSRLQQTQASYDQAMKRLKTGTGNLVRRTEELKKLGAQTNKQLEVEFEEE